MIVQKPDPTIWSDSGRLESAINKINELVDVVNQLSKNLDELESKIEALKTHCNTGGVIVIYLLLTAINGTTGIAVDRNNEPFRFKKRSQIANFARNQELGNATPVEFVEGWKEEDPR